MPRKNRSKKRQTGRTTRGRDRRRKAKHPGKRTSAQGGTYYERRRNRSDVDRRKRL